MMTAVIQLQSEVHHSNLLRRYRFEAVLHQQTPCSFRQCSYIHHIKDSCRPIQIPLSKVRHCASRGLCFVTKSTNIYFSNIQYVAKIGGYMRRSKILSVRQARALYRKRMYSAYSILAMRCAVKFHFQIRQNRSNQRLAESYIMNQTCLYSCFRPGLRWQSLNCAGIFNDNFITNLMSSLVDEQCCSFF